MPDNRYYFINTKLWISLIILLLSTGYLFAQGTGSIKGKVFDSQSKDVLMFASVVVENTSLGATTDADGKFLIRNVSAGVHNLVVSYMGYSTVKIEIEVAEGKTIEKNIFISPQSIIGQEIIVTAQAEGQLGAINQQLSSNTIENIVSKDRIKELPDVNAAESIGRLPGVSIERSGGEANNVEVRGLGPKYNLVTVNGVALPGSGLTDRGVDLSLISSNMLDAISLKKVITADMDAAVLGGTIDLKLREAPDSLVISASGQGGYNNLQNYKGNFNFTGSISDRIYFNDINSLGIILNVSTDNYDRSADKLNGNYAETQQNGSIQAKIQDLALHENKVNQKRTGASLLMDYIIPNGKLNAYGFYNQRKSISTFNTTDYWLQGSSYNSNRIFYQLERVDSTAKIYTAAVSIDQDFSWIRYDLTLSKAGSSGDTPNDRVWTFDQENSPAFLSELPPGYSTTLIPGKAQIDTFKTGFAELYEFSRYVKENNQTVQFNVKMPVEFNDQIDGFFKAGAKFHWLDRSNNIEQYGENGLNYGNGNTPNPILTAIDKAFPQLNIKNYSNNYGLLPIVPFLISSSRTNFLHGDYPLGFLLNPVLLNQITDYLRTTGTISPKTWLHYAIGSLGKDYTGSEAYQAAYIMGQFNITKYVTFIPGLRWEGEHTAYNGEQYEQYTPNNQEGNPVGLTALHTERNNSFWLPQVNLIVKPNDWLQIKLARTQTLSRPDYIQYAPISYVSSDHSQITATNSGLKTSRATNYDAEFSIYQNYVGYLSVEGFYKEINDLIFYSSYKLIKGMKPPADLNVPLSWYQTSSPQISTYRNNPNPAKYSGISVDWQTHFWYLPSFLQGLILDINLTHIYSEMILAYDSLETFHLGRAPRFYDSSVFVPRSVKTRMPNQPKNIANITIGYDYMGFSARVSFIYQTNKLSNIGYTGVVPNPVLSTYSGDYVRWDIALQQKITRNFQVYLNLNNINNRPDQTFTGPALADPSYYEYYGFALDFGVRCNL